ncbi:MAG: aminotransferase class V-fold PLP-dependent enzyme [Thermoplasmata archaeon]
MRRNFPAIRGLVFLASAGRAPMPVCTIKAMQSILARESEKMRHILDERPIIQDFRTQASRLIGARKDEVAFVTSTTNGINLFANAVRWKPGDNIVIGNIEYPANIIPWVRVAEKRGLEIRRVEAKKGLLSAEDYEKAVDDRTKVLPVSLVQFSNGQRMDIGRLSEICNRHGTMLFLDSIQALGAIKVDVRSYDISGISAGGYKWLCGPLGSGILYISKDAREELDPEMISWFGLEKGKQKSLWRKVVSGGNLVDRRIKASLSASAFDHYFENYIEVVGLTESIRFLRGIGLEKIERRILELTDYFIERLDAEDMDILTPRNPQERAGILSFSFWKGRISLGRARKIERALGKVKLAVRMNCIRSATHFFNSKEDIDIAIDAIRAASRRYRA